jgi:hypothetical protein
MATPATGELQPLASGHEARISFTGTNSKGFVLVPGKEAA